MSVTDDVCRVETVDEQGGYALVLPDASTDYLQKLIAESGRPYEEELLRDLASRLEPGDLVVDVGANVGNHTIYLAALAQAKVMAFEPNRRLAEVIRRSAALNGLEEQIEAFPFGVGRRESKARFGTEHPDNLGAQALELGSGDIRVVSLDQMEFPAPVRAIKVDVEGMELDVLDGAVELITRDRPLLYVEAQDEAAFKLLSRWMLKHGYSYWESFNVTPTHMYRPAEHCSGEERVERLMAREVLQEYRYNLLLRRARRFQKAAEQRAADLEKQLAGGDDRVPSPGPEEILSAIQAVQSRLDRLKRSEDEFAVQFGRLATQMDGQLVGLATRIDSIADEQRERLRRDLEAAHAFRLERHQADHEARGRQLRHMRRAGQRMQARIRELEESTAFQLGLALVEAGTSIRGALLLPVKLGRLVLRAFQRRYLATPARLPVDVPARGPLAPQLLAWVDATPLAARAVSILYADISPNVVDGSSVWLSSMASLLCSQGPCILVAKAPVTSAVVLSNVRHAENLVVLEPTVVSGIDQWKVTEAIDVVRELDALVPGMRRVVVRGLDAASLLLSDRRFAGRAAVYLTDFYSVSEEGRHSSSEQEQKVRICVAQAEAVLVQTAEIGREMERIGGPFKALELPPVVPDGLPAATLRDAPDDVIRIGYAGKVNSRWGVIELLDWAERAMATGLRIELHIVANRISNGPEPGYENLRSEILERISRLGAHHYTDFNREASISLMATMDFVWCYRPARFEDITIELSTKLVETAALGARCICYPSSINVDTLGADYPFFVRDYAEFMQLVGDAPWPVPPPSVAQRVIEKHGFDSIARRVGPALVPPARFGQKDDVVVLAGHDLKFIDAWASQMKAGGAQLLSDTWEWGRSRNEAVSVALRERATVIFCEWGLANAVWLSRNLPVGKRLVVRIHAQEVRERARRFGSEINADAVDAFVFVSDAVRRKALELWQWPEEKTRVVPNYVLDHEFTLQGRRSHAGVVLGMVGIVPTLKRFDRALDALAVLVENGVDARLKVKGHRPEQLEFMHAPGRREELEVYNALYDRIERDARLAGRVEFSPWGNDVAAWYKDVDVILSCSDTESFHYALADGVLSGCLPVVWPWAGAAKTYSPDWVVGDEKEAGGRIMAFMNLPRAERDLVLQRNRALVVGRYGFARISAELQAIIYGKQVANGSETV